MRVAIDNEAVANAIEVLTKAAGHLRSGDDFRNALAGARDWLAKSLDVPPAPDFVPVEAIKEASGALRAEARNWNSPIRDKLIGQAEVVDNWLAAQTVPAKNLDRMDWRLLEEMLNKLDARPPYNDASNFLAADPYFALSIEGRFGMRFEDLRRLDTSRRRRFGS